MRRFFDTPRKRVVMFALACWLVLLTVMQLLPVPFVRLAPGPLFDVLSDVDGEPVITVEGAKVHPTTGQLDMTTVSERGGPYGHLTLFEAFTGLIDKNVVVVPSSLLYPPDTTGDDAEQRSAAQFDDSQEKARIAALRELGEPVTSSPWVVEVSEDSPAQGILEHGDIVLSVNGRAVEDPAQMARIIRRAGPGATVDMDIRRGEQESTVQVVTAANPDNPDKGFLGVTLGVIADSPVVVDINLDDVGGPSAGLIFSLGIVDKLSPEDLIGDRLIAGTGTMDYDGKVGPIGGIAQKMAAAAGAGAELFLAPVDNCDEVRTSTPEGLEVVGVRSLSQAVEVLEGLSAGIDCAVRG